MQQSNFFDEAGILFWIGIYITVIAMHRLWPPSWFERNASKTFHVFFKLLLWGEVEMLKQSCWSGSGWLRWSFEKLGSHYRILSDGQAVWLHSQNTTMNGEHRSERWMLPQMTQWIPTLFICPINKCTTCLVQTRVCLQDPAGFHGHNSWFYTRLVESCFYNLGRSSWGFSRKNLMEQWIWTNPLPMPSNYYIAINCCRPVFFIVVQWELWDTSDTQCFCHDQVPSNLASACSTLHDAEAVRTPWVVAVGAKRLEMGMETYLQYMGLYFFGVYFLM